MLIATRVLFPLYHPEINLSHRLSPYPGNLSLTYQWGTLNSCHSLWTASSHWWLGKVCQLVNSIHQLVGGDWVKIGSMAGGRYYCLVVSPSPDKIIIVGGR